MEDEQWVRAVLSRIASTFISPLMIKVLDPDSVAQDPTKTGVKGKHVSCMNCGSKSISLLFGRNMFISLLDFSSDNIPDW